jgi:predicted P-loop ATPase
MQEPSPAGPFVPEIQATDSILEQALALVRAGLQLAVIHAPVITDEFPAGLTARCTCKKATCTGESSAGKHPVNPGWQSRPLRADQEVRDAFLRVSFTPNIGIVLGEQPSGAYVIAIDEDDPVRLELLEQEYGELPETATSESARGRKLFFSIPPSVDRARIINITGLGGTTGVDIKAKGGQVVAPPSRHATGNTYKWLQTGPIAELPAPWILAVLKKVTPPTWATGYTPELLRDDGRARRKAERYLEKATIGDASLVARSPKGQRNTAFYTSLCRVLPLAHGLALAQGHSYVVRELSRAAQSTGLSPKEIAATVKSAEKWLRESGAVRVMPFAVVPVPAGDVPPPPSPAASSSPPGSLDPITSETGTAPAGEPGEPGEPGGSFDGVPAADAFRQTMAARQERSQPDEPGIPDEYNVPSIRLLSDKNKNAPLAENVARILEQHPVWLGGPKLDTFRMSIVWQKIPEPIKDLSRNEWRDVSDADALALQGWLLSQPTELKIVAGKDTCKDGMILAGTRNYFDSLRDYANAFPPWDGVPRVDTWLTTYFGAPSTPGISRVGRVWLVASIARVYNPGCMVDVVPILESPQRQRIGKNRAVSALYGGVPYVQTPTITRVGENKELDRTASTSWCIHDDESKLFSSKTDSTKAWITRTYDVYRVPWDRMQTTAPRRAVLVCSTNKSLYFQDDENARFFPIRCGDIDVDAIARDREQIWAEAIVGYQAGELWFIPQSDPIWGELRATQGERKEEDGMTGPVEDFLSKLPAGTMPKSQLILDSLGIEPKDRTITMSQRLHRIMYTLGWEYVNVRVSSEIVTRAGLTPEEALTKYVRVWRAVVRAPYT